MLVVDHSLWPWAAARNSDSAHWTGVDGCACVFSNCDPTSLVSRDCWCCRLWAWPVFSICHRCIQDFAAFAWFRALSTCTHSPDAAANSATSFRALFLYFVTSPYIFNERLGIRRNHGCTFFLRIFFARNWNPLQVGTKIVSEELKERWAA